MSRASQQSMPPSMGGQVGDLGLYLYDLSYRSLSPLSIDNTHFHK